jgi:Raf kinase inhibitor-like YbhB/YbcL family protein
VLKLSSSSFEADGDIPVKYSCDGANSSPALAWTDPPAATQSFGLIVDDPDVPAKTVVHWLIYDIPGGTRSLPEGVPTKKKLADGSEQGQNIRRKVGYTGPCPEKGGPAHHYFFKLYALDAKTGLKPNAKKEELGGGDEGAHFGGGGGDWEIQALGGGTPRKKRNRVPQGLKPLRRGCTRRS